MRSIMKALAFAVLALIVLLAAGLIYLQTAHGFRHVLVPALAGLMKAEIEVRDGGFSLGGRLAFEGLKLKSERAGVALEVERAAVSASLLPLLRRQPPVIHDLEVHTITLALTEPMDAARPPTAEEQAGQAQPIVVIPVIERAVVDGFTMTRLTRSRTLALRDASLTLDHFGPGQTAAAKLTSAFLHEQGSAAAPLAGTVSMNLTLAQNAVGTVFRLAGSNEVVLEAGPLSFSQTFAGDYDAAGDALHLTTTVDARKGTTALGTTRAEVSLAGAQAEPTLQASVDLQGLTGEALTTLLAGFVPAQFASGRVDAQVQINQTGPLVGMRASLAGRELTLRRGTETSPPVNIQVNHAGSFDQRVGELSIQQLDAALAKGAQPLVTAKLARPIVMRIGAPESRGEAGNQSAALHVQLHGLSIRDLRAWLTREGHDPLTNVVAGDLRGSAEVTVIGEGQSLEVRSRLQAANVLIRTAGDGDVLGPLSFQNDTRASLTQFTTLTIDQCTTSIMLKNRQVGRLEVSAAGQVRKPGGIQALHGALQLAGLPLDALNPLLALRSPARFQRARLDGEGTIQIEGDRMKWNVGLRGSHVSLRLPDMHRPTPPLDVQVSHAGSLEQASGMLHLEKLAIQVLEGPRPVVRGNLDRPLLFPLSARAAGSGGNVESPPITLTIDISQLAVAQLRPWVAMKGGTFFAHVRRGEATGHLQLQMRGLADRMEIKGNLDLKDVQLERRDSPVMAAPFTLHARVLANVAGLSRITIDPSNIEIASGSQTLAQVTATGTLDQKAGTINMRVQAAAANLTETLDRVGLLTARQRPLIDGGSFTSDSTMTTAGPQQPIQLKTELQLDKLLVRLDPRQVHTQSVSGQGMVVIGADRRDLRFDHVGMTLRSGGATTGAFGVAGQWPLGGPSAPGEVTLTVKDWDASMPAGLFQLFPGREPGPLPVNVQVTIKRDAQGAVTVRGHEAVGPLSRKGAPGDRKTFHVEHDLSRADRGLRIASLRVTGKRSEGEADAMSLTGAVHLADRPLLQARGKVERLDVKWLADLFTEPGEPEQAEKAVAAVAAAPVAPTQTGKGIPADLDVDLEAGSLQYKGLKLEQGRLIARGTGGSLHTVLHPTKLAGGEIEAMVDVTMVRKVPHLKWVGRGRRLAVAALLQGLNPEREPPITGIGTFTTAGTGHGSGTAFKQSVTGTATFDLNQGRFVKSELLAFVAKVTQIKEIEGMGFDNFHVEAQARDGVVQLQKAHVVGPAIVLDAAGHIGLDGSLNVKISPRVSAELAQRVQGLCFAPLLHTVEGVTVFPFAVLVKGTVQKPSYGLDIRAEELVGKNLGLLAGGLLKTLQGCGEESVGGGAAAAGEAVDLLKGAAKGLFDNLLGSPKDRDRK
jgi:hypothetical protein